MIIRAKRKTNFTIISNVGMDDELLSFKARGVLAYLLTKPDNWQVNERHLETVGPDGVTLVRAALKELETCGYLKRERHRSESGKFSWVSTVYDEPCLENPRMDKPSADKPSAGNRTLIKTEETRTEETRTEKGESARVTEPPASPKEPLPPHIQNALAYANGQNPRRERPEKIIADAYTEQARKLGIDSPAFSRRINALAGCIGKRSYIDAAEEDNGTLNAIKAGVITLAKLNYHTESDYRAICESFSEVNDWMTSPVPTLAQLLDHAGKLRDGVVADGPKLRPPKPDRNGFYDFPDMASLKKITALFPDIANRVSVRGTLVRGV